MYYFYDALSGRMRRWLFMFNGVLKKNEYRRCNVSFRPLELPPSSTMLRPNYTGPKVLKDIPAKRLTPKLCLAEVTKNGRELKYVPLDMVSLTMCRIAVAQDGFNIYYVPEKFRSQGLYLAAVANASVALSFIPIDERTELIQMEAEKTMCREALELARKQNM